MELAKSLIDSCKKSVGVPGNAAIYECRGMEGVRYIGGNYVLHAILMIIL